VGAYFLSPLALNAFDYAPRYVAVDRAGVDNLDRLLEPVLLHWRDSALRQYP
jgi:hypothetical protein